MKYVVWGLLLFAGYSAWAYLPVLSTKSAISRAIEGAAPEMHEELSDEALVRRVVRRARVASLELDPDAIEVWIERRPGQRIVNVEVEHPVTFSYLGARTVMAHVSHSEIVPVDEGAEVRRLAQQQRREDRIEHLHEVNQAIQAKKRDAIERCERKTGGPCEITGSFGGGPGMAYDSEEQYELIERF